MKCGGPRGFFFSGSSSAAPSDEGFIKPELKLRGNFGGRGWGLINDRSLGNPAFVSTGSVVSAGPKRGGSAPLGVRSLPALVGYGQ